MQTVKTLNNTNNTTAENNIILLHINYTVQKNEAYPFTYISKQDSYSIHIHCFYSNFN